MLLRFHLESFTKQKLDEDALINTGICQNCFIKFNEYDEHFCIATRIQNEIVLMLDSTGEAVDMKLDIKREIDDYGIFEVMLEDDGEYSDVSVDSAYKKFSKHKTVVKKSPRDVDKRSYKRKKNLDEGLIVVEVDGEKIYQCEICKKLCKDRYKLKTHREIHTSTRNVCCTECGAMFKTLTCLYSHKKIHRERIYHQW